MVTATAISYYGNKHTHYQQKKKISSGYILCTKTKMKGMSEYVTSFIFHTHYELHSQSEIAEGTLYSYSLLGIRKTPTKNTCEVFSL